MLSNDFLIHRLSIYENAYRGIADRKPQGEPATSKSLKSNEAEVLNAKQRLIIVYCRLPRTARQILAHVGLSYQSKNIKKYITELTDLGYLKIVDSSVNEKQVTLYVKA